MSGGWQGSDRGVQLPPDWAARRALVHERAGNQCESVLSDGSRCRARSMDVHHAGRPENHDIAFLMAICGEHHMIETQKEAAAAREVLYRKARHPVDEHPGKMPKYG